MYTLNNDFDQSTIFVEIRT